jgi:hypothetical protein
MGVAAMERLLRDDSLLIEVDLVLGESIVHMGLDSGKPSWGCRSSVSSMFHVKENDQLGFWGLREGDEAKDDVGASHMALQDISGLPMVSSCPQLGSVFLPVESLAL